MLRRDAAGRPRPRPQPVLRARGARALPGPPRRPRRRPHRRDPRPPARTRPTRDRVGFFGFFESVDDPAVAGALFDAAAAWLRARGRDTLRGPLNPSINDEAGLLVDGFDTPSVLMMPHNPRYYPALVEGAGFRKAKDLLAFQNTHTTLPERLVAATDIVRKRYGVTCRRIDMRRFADEVALIKRSSTRDGRGTGATCRSPTARSTTWPAS